MERGASKGGGFEGALKEGFEGEGGSGRLWPIHFYLCCVVLWLVLVWCLLLWFVLVVCGYWFDHFARDPPPPRPLPADPPSAGGVTHLGQVPKPISFST